MGPAEQHLFHVTTKETNMSTITPSRLRATFQGSALRRAGTTFLAAAVATAAFADSSQLAAQGLPLIRDAEIEELLSDYSTPIFRAAGLGSQGVKIRIVRSSVFNAFVMDGQNVFINTGTLMISETPNQVIGVIAHETGHIAGGHMANLRSRVARDQTKSLLMKVLGIGLMVAGGLAGGGSSEGLAGAGKGIMLGGDTLLLRGLLMHRRAQESAADQAGLRYLTATEQSAKGMLETFERFARQEYISDQHKDPFARSHPVATARLARLRRRAAASRYFNKMDSKKMQLRHDLMRAKLWGYLEPPRHVMNKFRGRKDLPARLARAIARNCSGECARHIGDIDALIAVQPRNPYFWELKGSMLRKAGRPREAIGPLQKAVRLTRDKNVQIKVELARALVALKNRNSSSKAMKILKSALQAEGHDAAVYKIMGDAYYAMGKLPQAELATARSRYHAGDIKGAQRFAKRAIRRFKRGSREWLIATEIIKFKI